MMDMGENPGVDRVMLLGSDPHELALFTCICVVPLRVPIIPTRLLPLDDFKQAAMTSPVCTTNCEEVGMEICVQEVEAVVVCDAL